MTDLEFEHPFPRPPSGADVGRLPSALVPARTALIGRLVTLEPFEAALASPGLADMSAMRSASRG
jgi:hypothetical protein